MRDGHVATLFEASERFGGQTSTDVRNGFVVERGAEGFPAASPAVLGLARELGIRGHVVLQRTHCSYAFDGRLLSLLEAGEAPARLGLRVPSGQVGHGIASFTAGMGELVQTLLEAIEPRVELRHHAPIAELAAKGSEWELETAAGARTRFDAIVLATSARVAGDLLKRGAGETTGFEQAPAQSSVSVSLAYPRAAVRHDLAGTGFIVAEPAMLEGCRACTFASSKFPGRSPTDFALLRLFFRPSPADLECLRDEAWTDRAARLATRALSIDGDPEHAWVDRWPAALAVVDDEQRKRVAAVEQRLAWRGILLAGAAFHGPGIEAAVRSGEAAARRAPSYSLGA